MAFPAQRLRRLRASAGLRGLVRETRLTPSDLVMPFFVRPGRGERRPIASMPGQSQYSADTLVEAAEEARAAGVPACIVFGIPEAKDARGSGAWAEDGIVQRAIQELKRSMPDWVVVADLCFCEYTDHGHCGILARDGRLDNDATLDILGQAAVSQARAGADVIAPSGMIDGMVGRIRSALDAGGFRDTPILSYGAKYASAFYGPFRDAAESPPKFGDRSGYQMDPANALEALRELELDVAEGADMLMVKPALPYLDILTRAKERFGLPTAAYNVSGEYAMVKAAAAKGWVDERRITLEILTSIKRAGADFILTYHAVEAARWLSEASGAAEAAAVPA